MTVSQSTVAGNTAATGGGVYNTGTFNLYSSTVSGNTASNGNGGGIFSSSNVAGVELAVINSTVANNVTTQGSGGGVFTQDAQAVFTNSTIASNQAGANGGGLFEAVAGGATLNNTIVAQNTVAGAANDIGGAVVVATSKNNLIGTGGSGGLVNGLPNNNQVGVANPGLNPLGNYGGLTQTMSLQDTSAAVNNGSNALAVYPDGSPIVTDQRGKPRVFGASVDIGAVELQASLTFKLLSNGDLIQTKNELQSAIAVNVNAIAVDASNTLYEQEIDGSLWQYKNATWTMLDKNVAGIKLASDGTLYDLETSGLVRSYSNGVLAANPVRTGVESIGVNGTTLYMLQSNGNFSSFNGTTVTLINPKVSSFTVAPNGVYAYQAIGGPINVSSGGTVATGTSLVSLDSDANLWFLRAGSLVEDSTSSPALPQGTSIPNVVSALMTTDSANITSVDYLTISGNLVNTASGSSIDTGVRNFAVANNGTVYAIEAAVNLFAFNSDGKSSVLDNRAVTVQVSSSGLMYVLEDSSVLWVLSNLKGNAWTLVDTGTKSFGLTGAGVLWELEIGGRLWSQTSGTWTLMDSNSTSLFVAANGTMAELEPSGALWTFDTVAGWTLKESIAIQIAIAADSALVVLDNNQAALRNGRRLHDPAPHAFHRQRNNFVHANQRQYRNGETWKSGLHHIATTEKCLAASTPTQNRVGVGLRYLPWPKTENRRKPGHSRLCVWSVVYKAARKDAKTQRRRALRLGVVAKLPTEPRPGKEQVQVEVRAGQLRHFIETLDLFYDAFLARRLGADWHKELSRIHRLANPVAAHHHRPSPPPPLYRIQAPGTRAGRFCRPQFAASEAVKVSPSSF